jgi:hypothetical protein
MFNEVEGMMKRAINGEIDRGQLQQAAEQHVQSVDDQTLKQNAQQAAQNAAQNGKPDLARQIASLLEQHGNDPQALKQGVIDLIRNNPEVLQHFEGGFAKNLLSRI